MERKRTHPDFMILKGKEQLFYLEATLVTLSDTNAATKARENRVYDTLNEMKSPNFFIDLKVHGAPDSSPPGRKIRDFLERRLAGLNSERIATQFEQGSFRRSPSWKWEYEGWQITFFPIPKSPFDRGKPGIRPIGIRMQEPKWVTPHIGIRNSIYDKASKYGKLSLPYVVAIDVIDESGADDIDISNALFGKEQLTVVLRRNVLISQVKGHKPNGAWYSQNGPQNKRVSAVLIAVNLCSWSITKTTPILWHNPWANYTLSQDVWSPPQVVPDIENNRLVKRDGKSNWKLLGLYPNWPNTCKEV